jgi:protein-disulfide isomerase
VEEQQSSPKEVFTVSRELVNIVIVGIVFMVAGVFIGLTIAGQNLDARQVRNIIKDEMEVAIRNNLSDTLVAAVGTTTDQIRTVVREELANADVSSASASVATLDTAQIESIVMGAINQLERQRNYMMGDGPYLGPEDAPIVIVEFSDFLCGFCGRHFSQTLTPLLENFDGYVRYGVGGQNAVESALAAKCAFDQDSFWQYHNLLFSNQASLGGDDLVALGDVLVGYAESLGLDVDVFTECYQSQQHLSRVVRDSNDAQSVGARGTPGFVVNGQFVSGAQPYEVFEMIILEELTRLGIEYVPPISSQAS